MALEAFGIRKDLRSVPIISGYLWDKDDEIKLSALKVADMIGGIADNAYFQRLLLLYKHKDWKIRQKVAETLGSFQNDTGIEALDALLKDKNINVGISAGNSLLKLGQNGQRALEQTYNGSDEAARAVAAFVLQRYGILLKIETEEYLCKLTDSFCDRIIKIIGGIFNLKESLPLTGLYIQSAIFQRPSL